ncbi:MAG TPA: hypothetical protein VL523_09080, partial [Terriglobia bacterium]|nr:hypothetical protein [Terriglobia bacterium]
MKRRSFLKRAAAFPAAAVASRLPGHPGPGGAAPGAARPSIPRGRYHPGRIPNEYNLYLPGEREALAEPPRVAAIVNSAVKASAGHETRELKTGDSIAGWRLVSVLPWLNGVATAVFEKHVTHQGAIVYVTEEGEVARIPKRIGDLSRVRPRPQDNPHGVKLERPARYPPGPDVCGEYLFGSDEDACYENVAALGAELIGWTLVANEEAGPEKSLWLEPDGKSRQLAPAPEALWAPDTNGRLFDPRRFLPSEYLYEYTPGYSKRTQLGGFLPAADIGVWNPRYGLGYEVMVLLPPGAEARPIGRVRVMLPPAGQGALIPAGDTGAARAERVAGFADHYWNGAAEDFFSALAGVWNRWHHFFEDRMTVEIPDEWLLDSARAGIALARTSYRGLEPTYQIGEGAYTKIPERSHALFPVAHYEFVWTHQLWNLADEVEPYFQHYLERYILPDGNFVYNTQDQVEAPLNAGIFLENSARAYDYTGDVDALRKRLPALRRMIDFVERRYRYSKTAFPPGDPRHGLIWGSPEADNGDPNNDFPDSHPYYYQNASWTWRGLAEHARCLARAAADHNDDALRRESDETAKLAHELRADVERSLARTLSDRNPALKAAGITPFTAFDTRRRPDELSSYENHRYMMDWWTSDWGDPELDLGHFRHRVLAGQQILGMNIDGEYPRTSNFMEHGTLAGRIRQNDYRWFLIALYGNLCYAMDSGSRYAPEDALLPGNFAGEGSPYAWSAVVNSVLQPSLALRWLLCYEEHDRPVVHLQKAAPKHWFEPGETIRVERCPTRFGEVSWTTESRAAADGWQVEVVLSA